MIQFSVYGSPAPQGSKSFKGIHGGKAVLAESSKAVKPWRQNVHWAAVQARDGAAPMDGPLHVTMVFTLPKPQSAPKRRVTFPNKKPDLSKLVRSTEDALVTAGLIIDDSRIVRLIASKCYPGEGHGSLEAPGVRISIQEAA